MQTYLFYDIETTGLNKAFDQVLHFAAIRTDLNLKELERYEVKVKLNPDVIPSPYAIITHKMGIEEISAGINEFEASKQIHQWMNEPGTISLGYNTLGFDDEFLRFTFYRNLLKPYTHQFANQCSRMDIYPMTVMFYLFKNNILAWPELDGRVSLKLENLNHANQFIQGRSHHAMVDVEITLEMARRFFKEREQWDYLQGYFKKDTESSRLKSLMQEPALLISGKLGSKLHFQCPALYLGQHVHYRNQSLWLRLDTPDLMSALQENIAETTWVINKKPGEPNFILPLKERFLQQMDETRLTLATNHAAWLQKNPEILASITAYHANYQYPVFPDADIDARLYLDGFWTAEDDFFCQRFHKSSVKDKVKLTEQAHHPKFKALAKRILMRHFPETLDGDQKEQNKSQAIDYQGKKRLTVQTALEELHQLRAEKSDLSALDITLLAEFEAYLYNLDPLQSGKSSCQQQKCGQD